MSKSDILSRLQEQREKYDEMQLDYLRLQDENQQLVSQVHQIQNDQQDIESSKAEFELFRKLLPDIELNLTSLLHCQNYLNQVATQFENIRKHSMEQETESVSMINYLRQFVETSVPRTELQQVKLEYTNVIDTNQYLIENQKLIEQIQLQAREIDYKDEQLENYKQYNTQLQILLETERDKQQTLNHELINNVKERSYTKINENLEIQQLQNKVRHILEVVQNKDLEIQDYQNKFSKLQTEMNELILCNLNRDSVDQSNVEASQNLTSMLGGTSQFYFQNQQNPLNDYISVSSELQQRQFITMNELIDKAQYLIHDHQDVENTNSQLLICQETYLQSFIEKVGQMRDQFSLQQNEMFQCSDENQQLKAEIVAKTKTEYHLKKQIESLTHDYCEQFSYLQIAVKTLEASLDDYSNNQLVDQMQQNLGSMIDQQHNYFEQFNDEQLAKVVLQKQKEAEESAAMLTRRIRAIFHQSVRENDNFHLKPLRNLESLKEELFDLESEMETFIKQYLEHCREIDAMRIQFKNQQQLLQTLNEKEQFILSQHENLQNHKNQMIKMQTLLFQLQSVQQVQNQIVSRLNQYQSETNGNDCVLQELRQDAYKAQHETIEALARVNITIQHQDYSKMMHREVQTVPVNFTNCEVQCNLKEEMKQEDLEKLLDASMVMAGSQDKVKSRTVSPAGRQLQKAQTQKIQFSKPNTLTRNSNLANQVSSFVIPKDSMKDSLSSLLDDGSRHNFNFDKTKQRQQDIQKQSRLLQNASGVTQQYMEPNILINDAYDQLETSFRIVNDEDNQKLVNVSKRKANLDASVKQILKPTTLAPHASRINTAKIDQLRQQLKSSHTCGLTRRQPGNSLLSANLAKIANYE